jgi:hypothetical protein
MAYGYASCDGSVEVEVAHHRAMALAHSGSTCAYREGQ